MLATKSLVNTFGMLIGNKLRTAPRSYPIDHQAIELLRRKQFLLKYKFADKEVYSPDFFKKVNDGFKKMRPFLNFMIEVLTTDRNGVSIVD